MSLLDLWKIECKENNKRPSPSTKENISTTMKKKKYKESCVENSTKPGKKNFHGLSLTRPKTKCFVEFAVNIPPFVTKVAAFLWVLTVHRRLVFVMKA